MKKRKKQKKVKIHKETQLLYNWLITKYMFDLFTIFADDLLKNSVDDYYSRKKLCDIKAMFSCLLNSDLNNGRKLLKIINNSDKIAKMRYINFCKNNNANKIFEEIQEIIICEAIK